MIISKVLAGTTVAMLILAGTFFTMLKFEQAETAELSALNESLKNDIHQAELVNQNLNIEIDQITKRRDQLLTQIELGEAEKRKIRYELEVTSEELKNALNANPEFRAYRLPDPVAAAVNSQLDRLWPERTDSDSN